MARSWRWRSALVLCAAAALAALPASATTPAPPCHHTDEDPLAVGLRVASAMARRSTHFFARFDGDNSSQLPPHWSYGAALLTDGVFELAAAVERARCAPRGGGGALPAGELVGVAAAWMDVMAALPGTDGYNVSHGVGMPFQGAVGDSVG